MKTTLELVKEIALAMSTRTHQQWKAHLSPHSSEEDDHPRAFLQLGADCEIEPLPPPYVPQP